MIIITKIKIHQNKNGIITPFMKSFHSDHSQTYTNPDHIIGKGRANPGSPPLPRIPIPNNSAYDSDSKHNLKYLLNGIKAKRIYFVK